MAHDSGGIACTGQWLIGSATQNPGVHGGDGGAIEVPHARPVALGGIG